MSEDHIKHLGETVLICTSGSGGDAVERNVLSTALATILMSEIEPFRQFWLRALLETMPVK